MRGAGFGLLGFLAGAIAGVLVALVFVILWYDVLQKGDHGGDGLSGASTFMVVAPLLALAGGIIGAFWFAGRARAGSKGMGILIVGAVLVLAVFLTLGPMVAL